MVASLSAEQSHTVRMSPEPSICIGQTGARHSSGPVPAWQLPVVVTPWVALWMDMLGNN